jgi:thymidine kinase
VSGYIEVITGPMFAAKTETLIDRLETARAEGRSVKAFKSELDGRYQANDLATHTGKTFPALGASTTWLIRQWIPPGADVYGIDEAHLFQTALVELVDQLADAGATVYVAGLDRDYSGQPFGTVAGLLAIADRVTKLTAKCQCGAEAAMTQRLVPSDRLILIGGADAYRPICRACRAKLRPSPDPAHPCCAP